MKTYRTVAIETDINGIDGSEELNALFIRALEICQTTKASQGICHSPPSSQILSFPGVTYCVQHAESVDIIPVPLPDIDFQEVLNSVWADFAKTKQIKEAEIDETKDMDTDNSITKELGGPDHNKVVDEHGHTDVIMNSGEIYRNQGAPDKHVTGVNNGTLTILKRSDNENINLPETSSYKETLNLREASYHGAQNLQERTINNSILNLPERLYYGVHSLQERSSYIGTLNPPQRTDPGAPNLLSKKFSTRPHSCSKCGKHCINFKSLRSHIRSKHKKARPYKCQFCASTFTQTSHLKLHNRTHFQREMLTCSTCDKQFYYKACLDKHMHSHKIEKPHKCQFCVMEFANMDDLAQHLTENHSGRPYKCELCNMAFVRKCKLDVHLKTHT